MNRFVWNKLRQCAAFLTAALMLLPAMPVLANKQTPIADMTVQIVGAPATGYPLRLDWRRPRDKSQAVDTGTGADADDLKDPTHSVAAYRLYYRNATARAGNSTNELLLGDQPDVPAADVQTRNVTEALSPGSLYVFRAEPYHMHKGAQTQTGQNPPVTSHVDTAYPDPQAIFMTDLRVEAAAVQGKLMLTWDAPTFGAASKANDPFEGYRILFARNTAALQNGNYADNNMTATSVSKDALVLNTTTGKYTYTLEDPNISGPGNEYAVKVWPIVNYANNTAVNDGAFSGKLTVKSGNAQTDYQFGRSGRNYLAFAKVDLDLIVREESQDSIRLIWAGGNGLPIPPRVDYLVIRYSPNESMVPVLGEVRLHGETAEQTSSIPHAKPGDTMYYQIEVYYKDGTSLKSVPPTKYDPHDEKYRPLAPNILPPITDNATPTPAPLRMDVSWEAFYRPLYYVQETPMPGAVGNYKVDDKIAYDIWVADDIANLDKVAAPIYTFAAGQAPIAHSDPATPWYYKTDQLTEYYADENGTKKALAGNKVYYIKIVARRTDGPLENGAFLISEPAYGSHYIPPTGPVAVRPYIVAKLPLRVIKEDVASIDIQWDTAWWEMYDAATSSWYTTVGIKDKAAYFGDKITDGMTVVNLNDEAVKGDPKDYLEKMGVDMDLLPLRYLTLPKKDPQTNTGTDYDIHVVEYDVMEAAGGYELYVGSILNDASKWRNITNDIKGAADHPVYSVTVADNPGGALKQNTAYAIMLRPRTTDWAYYPNVVIGTTLATRPPLNVKPTVPLIHAAEGKESGSTNVAVHIEYKEGLEYELVWSELVTDYSGGGTRIPYADIAPPASTVVTENGKTWLEYSVQELFPETNYYLWVRAIAPGSTEPPSEWSNYVIIRTKDLAPPAPPAGLGPAAKDRLEIINKEQTLELQPTDFNYIILEWMRDVNDMPAAGAGVTAGRVDGGGDVTILTSENIMAFCLAQFSGLSANRPYFIRAKTILTVTKGNPGLIRLYQYVIELSENEDFTDAIRLTIPADGGDAGGRRIVKESPWTATKRVYTTPSKGEYDGDKNPELYPLPQDDFELIYDAQKDTLTYRFRSNGKDAAGNADNGVDQRFISKLIADKTFRFALDLSTYNGKDVATRTVDIPYRIIKTFTERKIAFAITAGDLTVTLPAGFMETAETAAMTGFGAGASINVTLTKNTGVTPKIDGNETYAASRQKLTITAKTPAATVNLAYTGQPITVAQRLTGRAVTIDKTVGAYAAAEGAWARQKDSYNQADGALTFQTTKPGVYTAIARSAPAAQSVNRAAQDAMLAVGSAIAFRDLPSYNPNANIPANDLDKIIVAITKNAKEVYVKAALSDADKQALSKAGMLVTGQASVAREEAISALVRLYEVKTKRKVEPYTPLAQSPYKDISGAKEQYRAALLKAGDLGFYSSPSAASPKAALTYGDAMIIVDYIMSDAGMY